jgi:hypothetical protein
VAAVVFGQGIDLGGSKAANAAIGTATTDLATLLQARRDIATFFASGPLIVSTGTLRFPIYGSFTIIGALAMVGTAPTGASLIVDILKNGSTIFTTTGNRPTIAAAANVSQVMVSPDINTVVLNDYLTLNIAQIGSTVAGSDLTVVVVADRTG